jgi:hypothetical protein
MNALKFSLRGGLLLMLVLIFSCTSQEELFKKYKEQAVQEAWELEQKLVKLGHGGTRDWSKAQKNELIKTGKVSGYMGEYINENIENNQQLATQSNNIVFTKMGEETIPEYALKLAPLRTYLVKYQKNKFYFWSSFVIVLVILVMSFKKGQGTITYPATAGALLGAIKVSLVSPSSLGIIGGLISGLMIGTVVGIFVYLVVLSAATG